MVTPFAVDRLQQHLLFNVAHVLGAELFGLLCHHGIAGLDQTFADHFVVHALFFTPGRNRYVQVQLLDNSRLEPLGIPLICIGFRRHKLVDQIVDHLFAHVRRNLLQVRGFHDVAALAKDDLPLVIHHIIELQQLFANVKVATFDLGLCPFERLVHPRVHNRLAFFQAKRGQHFLKPFRPEDTHQIVLERQIERRAARVTLTAGTTTQLVIDPTAFVTFRSQNIKATGLQHFFLFVRVFRLDLFTNGNGIGLWIGVQCFDHLQLDVAAQLNVGAATGHVCGNGHRAEFARICDDLGFLFVLACVQNVMRNAPFGQHLAEHFGLFDGRGTDQNRLPYRIGFFDLFDHRLIFFQRGTIDLVIFVNACNRHVGRHNHNTQTVDLGKFFGFGFGRTGHPGELVVQSEIVLESDGRERDVLRLDLAAFLRFDRLVQTVGQTATGHHAPGEFVDQHHFAIAHDVIFVAHEQLMRPQTLVYVVHDRGAFRVIHREPFFQQAAAQQLFLEEVVPFVGKGHIAGFFVQLIVAFVKQRDHIIDDFIHLGAVLRRARDNQWRPCFIDQNTVDLIHDGKVVLLLENLAQLGFHVIAEIIKAQLVVRGIGHIAFIRGAFVFFGHARDRGTGGQPQRGKDLAHPVGVPLHEVFVHRHHMHALAGQRIQIGGQRGGQGFTFTGFLLGYIALMQENRGHQLRVKGAQTQGPACAFTAVCKGFRQQVFKAFAIVCPLAQLFCFLL